MRRFRHVPEVGGRSGRVGLLGFDRRQIDAQPRAQAPSRAGRAGHGGGGTHRNRSGAAPAHADVITSAPIPVRLGFTGSFDLGDPPAQSGSFGFFSAEMDIGDVTATVTADIDASVQFSYDRADVKPGQNVPITITYTPTNDAGADLSIDARADVFIDCSTCSSTTLPNVDLIQGSGNFVAPLNGDAPVSIPVSSDKISLSFLGDRDRNRAAVRQPRARTGRTRSSRVSAVPPRSSA